METQSNQIIAVKDAVLKTIDEIQAKLKYDVNTLVDVYDTVVKLAKKLDPIYEELRKEFGDKHSLDKERIKKWAKENDILKDCNMMEHIIYKLDETRNNISNAEDNKDIAYNLANFAADLACKLYGNKGGHIHFSDSEPVVACESWERHPWKYPRDERFKAGGWRVLRKFNEMLIKIIILRINLIIIKIKIKILRNFLKNYYVGSIANVVNKLTNIIVKYEEEFGGAGELSKIEWLSREELKIGLNKLSAKEIAKIVDIIRSALDRIIKAALSYEIELIDIEDDLKINEYKLCKMNILKECNKEICNDIVYNIIYELANVVGHVYCVAKGYPCGGLDLETAAHIDCGCTEDDISPVGFCGNYPSLEKGEGGKEDEEEKCRESL